MEERRQRLLAAGRECFGEGGAAGPWVGEVCARAGVSKRHFYEIYADRLDLVHALHLEAMEWFKDGFEDDAYEADPVAWLAQVVPSLVAKLNEDPLRGRVLALAPIHLPDGSTNLADVLVEGVVRRVQRVPGRPRVPKETVRRHAIGSVFAGRAVLAEWLLAPGGPARGQARARWVTDVVSVSTAALRPVLP